MWNLTQRIIFLYLRVSMSDSPLDTGLTTENPGPKSGRRPLWDFSQDKLDAGSLRQASDCLMRRIIIRPWNAFRFGETCFRSCPCQCARHFSSSSTPVHCIKTHEQFRKRKVGRKTFRNFQFEAQSWVCGTWCCLPLFGSPYCRKKVHYIFRSISSVLINGGVGVLRCLSGKIRRAEHEHIGRDEAV